MAVKKTFYPIPPNTPYDGPGSLFLVCVPDDQIWKTAFREAVRQLTKGRYWDRDTGSIIEAQNVGREIYNSMINCTELMTRLLGIENAIRDLALSSGTQGVCCETLTPPDPVNPPPAPIPPPDPTPPDLPPAYGGDVTAYNNELCRMVNALHWQIRKWIDFLANLTFWGAAIGFIVALGLLLFPEPASTAIGGITLATIFAYAMGVSGGLGTLGEWAQGALVVWDSAQTNFVCTVYNIIGTTTTWKDEVADEVITVLESVGGSLPGDRTVSFFMGWLSAFLGYFEDAIYNFTQTLEDHENPVDCNCSTPCNSCEYDMDGLVYGSSSTLVYTGDISTSQPYRLEWDPDDTRFYLLAQGGGFQPGRFRFPEVVDADCVYCVSVIIDGVHGYGAYYCAKRTDSATFSTSEVDPSSVVWVPPGSYSNYEVLVPIDPGGSPTLPLTLGIAPNQQSNAIVSIRVRWKGGTS